MFKLGQIIGKKVEKLRGFKTRKNQKNIETAFILFDDGETYIDLISQDEYIYHDCNCGARTIRIEKDAELWRQIAYDSDRLGDANIDI